MAKSLNVLIRPTALGTALLLAASGSAFAGPTALPPARPGAALVPVQFGDGAKLDRKHRPNGGYHVNRYGFGNYTRGTDGGFGGYPAGSAGAQILQEQQRRKCQAVPETC